MENHKKWLESLCRICTKRLGRVSYSLETPAEKKNNKILIQECFDCPIPTNPDIHPSRYCNSCYCTMKRMWMAKKNGRVYRTSLTLSCWEEHQDSDCVTCGMMQGRKLGGRPKTTKSICGCPGNLVDHIRSVAGTKYRCSDPLTISRFIPETAVCMEELVCKSCNNIIDEPVELPCKHTLCCACCFQLLRSNSSIISCPRCNQGHSIVAQSFQSPPPLMDKLLKKLVVRCEREKCMKFIHLSDLKSHLESKCTLYAHSVQHFITLDQVLQQPADIPPTQIEMETAGHVVRKILSQSQTPFSLPTGGHVSTRSPKVTN